MKEKKYISDIPELMKEWDWEANSDLDPNRLVRSSQTIAQWKCRKCGHSWKTRICNRASQGTGCPACAGSILLVGKNDLETKFPEIAKEWNYEKNVSIKPQDIRPGTHQKYWWKCPKCEYEWLASPNNRTNHNSKCPNCTQGASILKKMSDEGKQKHITFIKEFPEIAKEWHPNKNGNFKPYDFKSGSSKKVWWFCSACGNEWQATIGSRTKGGGCPRCNRLHKTSFPEQAFFYYICKLYPDAINSYKAPFLGKMELDIYIPSLKWAIEYDGKRWHKKEKIKQEQIKYKKCTQNGIKLFRIREEMADLASDIADGQIGIIKFNGKESLEETIKYLIKRLNFSHKPININLKRDEQKIREGYRGLIKKSFSALYPDLKKEWHPTKNGLLKPENFYAGSEYLAWWQCSKCGYEWQTMIKQRTGKKSHNCPQCSHQKIVVGMNDLATTHPHLAEEWNPVKNDGLTPNDVISGFGKKYWWKCSKCGHDWQATIVHRKFSKSGCPLCANKVLVSGKNDLATKAPNIAKEWDYEKNENVKPNQVHAGSNKKAWWKCSICGRSWQAAINSRVHYNRDGCRSCNHTSERLRIKPKHKTNRAGKPRKESKSQLELDLKSE